MRDHAVVFHRYNLEPRPFKVWHDRHCPILASIATLRAVNKTAVKVYVLDVEPVGEEWGDFPRLLDFHVIMRPPQIPIHYDRGHPYQGRALGRIWDVWSFSQLVPERIIIYADSDILWLRDPLPLANDPVDRFFGDVRGDGFFYYDKHSLLSEVFVNCWRALTVAGILSDEIRTMMRVSGYHSPELSGQLGYCYLVRNGMTRGWSPVDPLEHYFPATLAEEIDPAARCLHPHNGLFGSDRLRVARRVVEFNEAIRSALPIRHADLLLGTDPPDVRFLDVGGMRG